MFKYFTELELRCTCCQKDGINLEFMEKIENLREALSFPFIVTSGYRCPEHPIEAVKASVGAHTTGRAIDISVRGEEAYRLIKGALNIGFKGIGVNQKGDSRFVHIDDIQNSPERPRPWVWSY